MATLTITIGLPGSGKSTWARDQVARDSRLRRVNRDELRAELFGTPDYSREQEHRVTAVQFERIRGHLLAGVDVIADDTNTRPAFAEALRQLAADCGADFVIEDRFTAVDVDECVARQASRPKAEQVPEGVIRQMATDLVLPFGHPLADRSSGGGGGGGSARRCADELRPP